MARTPSTMLELGTSAPDFNLPDPKSGNLVGLNDFAGSPLLVIFMCNHCPYVVHIVKQLSAFASEYQAQGLKIVAINANDVANYPEDSPEKMIEFAAAENLNFPYLYDESQQVAQAYNAACTPDLFMFDSAHKLVYRGQFDGSRPRNDLPVTGEDLRTAADALLSGNAMPEDQIPSLGCNIKWKAGNEPAYWSAP